MSRQVRRETRRLFLKASMEAQNLKNKQNYENKTMPRHSKKKIKKFMAKKWLQAKDILAAKGYQAKKFDTAGFIALIGDYFMSHDIKDTIYVKPARFVEHKNAPDCGYIDHLDTEVWKRRIDAPNDSFDFCDYIVAIKAGKVRPTIVVDEPFIKNAVYMVGLMGGYVVKKASRGSYIISLV